jgi:hypothetical protein
VSHQDGLSQWTEIVSSRMPQMSKSQARVLALFSFGMVLARSCAVSAVAVALSPVLIESPNTLRQRLREFCYESDHKRGAFRCEIDVSLSFVPLMSWVLSQWQGRNLALAMDATTLSDRFVVLCLSVVFNGCAIPVAWTVLSAKDPHAWKPEWLRLLRLMHGAVPNTVQVIVLADRGLYARWLFQRIVRLGWHPLLRINTQGSFRPSGACRFLPLKRFAPACSTCWAGAGTAFSTPGRRLRCTLLARWETGYKDPWLVLTDLPPEEADVLWYGMRTWIERGFKSLKRGGFQWQNTRMQDPKRAERLWLCVAVTTLWLLSVADQAEPPLFADHVCDAQGYRTRTKTRLRLYGLFRLGFALILAALLRGQPIPPGSFHPQPWPRAGITTNHEPITYP